MELVLRIEWVLVVAIRWSEKWIGVVDCVIRYIKEEMSLSYVYIYRGKNES